jgi:hypothetical protein
VVLDLINETEKNGRSKRAKNESNGNSEYFQLKENSKNRPFARPQINIRLSKQELIVKDSKNISRKSQCLKCFSPDNMAVIERISLEQLCEHEAINIFASCGSSGNSLITEPKSVKFPSSSRAAR